MNERPSSRALLEAALDGPGADLGALLTVEASELDAALRGFVRDHGGRALPVVTALADRGAAATRKVARRALYRLTQSGVKLPAAPGPPVEASARTRPVRAWLSGIDGSGSRAAWILFEGPYGALTLCSLILNDVSGILEAAGGSITKKRLGAELASLRAEQKLPWVEVPASHAGARVADALALHERLGTSPPAAFARWRKLFEFPAAAPPPDASGHGETAPPGSDATPLLERPELLSWFLEPERLQSDAVKLMEARESRLVVSDQIKAEREEAIVADAIDREMPPETRALWARRLAEMALIFEATAQPREAALARGADAELRDLGRPPHRIAFARALATRALEVAIEVASGRMRAADVSRAPRA